MEPAENLVEAQAAEGPVATAKQLPQLREEPREPPLGLTGFHHRVAETLKGDRIAKRVFHERHPRCPLPIILWQGRKAVAEPRRWGERIDSPPL